jgi:hypothetical protein
MRRFATGRWIGIKGIYTAVLLAVPFCVDAQEVDVDLVRTRHEAQLRVAPKADAAIAFSVPAETDLIWVARSQSHEFYRVVRTDQGPQAWVAAGDVAQAHKAVETPAQKVCATTLDECPRRGCEKEGTAAAESNELKRRLPKLGVPVTLTFDDFAQLQRQGDALIGQGPHEPTPQQRAQLHDLQVRAGRVSEGDLVRVIGYIAKGDEGLHVNKAGESVNCELKKPVDNDFHIPLVETPGNSEFKGIVVEMIPQERPAAWSIDALKEIQAQGLHVWAEGALSYDKIHYVNDDPGNALKDEPDRMSLWEIHPVTKFLVCRKPHCDPQGEEDWTPLDAK